MPIKIENQVGVKLPRTTLPLIHRVFDALPREHSRGIERVRLVNKIDDPRLRVSPNTQLPGLYHPKQSAQTAWLEVSIDALLTPTAGLPKRLLSRLAFKNNLAALLISLVGQHHLSTMRHSLKRGQLEPAVRAYTERHLKIWSQQEHKVRARIFKPLEPTLQKWAKKVQAQAQRERRKAR